MPSPAGAMGDVNIRHRLFGLTFKRLNIVVFGVTATAGDLLVLLQLFNVFQRPVFDL